MADSGKPGLPFIFDIGTKGGIVFWGTVGLVVPIVYVGAATVAWTASYVLRVANKDMTYAKQLKDYEQAVIQKRFDELNEDEVDALMGEIYPEKPAPKPTPE